MGGSDPTVCTYSTACASVLLTTKKSIRLQLPKCDLQVPCFVATMLPKMLSSHPEALSVSGGILKSPPMTKGLP